MPEPSAAAPIRPARTPSGAAVVTVGTYDGVHLGHQRLIAESKAEGEALGLPVVAVTFDRLPAEVIRPESTPKLLTGLEHKLELLDGFGVDDIVVLHFDQARAAERAEDFVANFLVGELGARAIFVGANFRFGNRALGDAALLEQLSVPLGFVARGIELVVDSASNTVVSSTRIRGLVADGELGEAARLLGRDYELRGLLIPDASALVVSGAFALPPAGSYDVVVGSRATSWSSAVATIPELGTAAAEVLVALAGAEAAPGGSPPRGGAAVAIRFSSGETT